MNYTTIWGMLKTEIRAAAGWTPGGTAPQVVIIDDKHIGLRGYGRPRMVTVAGRRGRDVKEVHVGRLWLEAHLMRLVRTYTSEDKHEK